MAEILSVTPNGLYGWPPILPVMRSEQTDMYSLSGGLEYVGLRSTILSARLSPAV
jgi:hypothetical protein